VFNVGDSFAVVAARDIVRAAVRAVLAIVKTIKPLEPNFVAKKPTRIIPLFGASYAAGSPEVPGDLTPTDYETTDTRAEFAVHVNGNSMEPYLPDGSIALGMKRAPEDGEVGAFYLDGGFLVKQVCQDSQGNVYLFSLNRERSDADDIIWHDSGRELMVMGTIIMDKRVPLP
jgi:phage repressor protein C with HTH and peptisase S24 domain